MGLISDQAKTRPQVGWTLSLCSRPLCQPALMDFTSFKKLALKPQVGVRCLFSEFPGPCGLPSQHSHRSGLCTYKAFPKYSPSKRAALGAQSPDGICSLDGQMETQVQTLHLTGRQWTLSNESCSERVSLKKGELEEREKLPLDDCHSFFKGPSCSQETSLTPTFVWAPPGFAPYSLGCDCLRACFPHYMRNPLSPGPIQPWGPSHPHDYTTEMDTKEGHMKYVLSPSAEPQERKEGWKHHSGKKS